MKPVDPPNGLSVPSLFSGSKAFLNCHLPCSPENNHCVANVQKSARSRERAPHTVVWAPSRTGRLGDPAPGPATSCAPRAYGRQVPLIGLENQNPATEVLESAPTGFRPQRGRRGYSSSFRPTALTPSERAIGRAVPVRKARLNPTLGQRDWFEL